VLEDLNFEKGWLLLALFYGRDFDFDRDCAVGFAQQPL
jgi:hypothetical protein